MQLPEGDPVPVPNNSFARLIVERGAPYDKGMCFPLPPKSETIIGRATNLVKPELSFTSLFISRRHCCIACRNDIWSIAELGSKHGTVLNGKPLEPHQWYPLHHGDVIILATSIALIHFAQLPELEGTLDFDTIQTQLAANNSKAVLPVVIDTTRKTLHLNKVEIALSLKEWSLLDLLYKNRNTLVSYAAIRAAVWTERTHLDNGLPDVGSDEINLLLYRLRRKLGSFRHIVKTHRGQGCILELE